MALDAGLPVTVPGMQVDQAVRLGSAGRDPGAPAGPQRRQRSGGRRRCREHEQRRVPLHGHAVGGRPRAGCRSHDALARGAHHRGRHVTTRCRAACWRPPRTCDGSTASPATEQDELAVTFASTQRSPRSRIRDPGRGDHSGHRAHLATVEEVIDTDEHPRADTTVGGADQAQTRSAQARIQTPR